MSRRPGRSVATSALLLLLSGCSSPPADVPTVEPVKVGACFAPGSDEEVSCSSRHLAQAIYVSEDALGSDASALEPCRRAQKGFLGQDFNTRLDVRLWVAQDESWYRCDVLLRKSTRAKAGYEVLTGSLKGGLRRGVAVDLQACLGSAFDPTADQVYVPCDEPHAARELIVPPAIGTFDEAFPADIEDRATNACNATADAAGELTPGRTVSAYYPASSAAWATGERTADCWLSAERGSLPAVRPGAR
ncbi:MAG: septum formation family protein [Actinomycetota bacterium]|nr:septum formation family protein [Actinomycetota bacterium]